MVRAAFFFFFFPPHRAIKLLAAAADGGNLSPDGCHTPVAEGCLDRGSVRGESPTGAELWSLG